MQQVWLFLVVPSVAGIVAGLPFRMRILEVPALPPREKEMGAV